MIVYVIAILHQRQDSCRVSLAGGVPSSICNRANRSITSLILSDTQEKVQGPEGGPVLRPDNSSQKNGKMLRRLCPAEKLSIQPGKVKPLYG